MILDKIKEKITKTFAECLDVDIVTAGGLLPQASTAGKIYEAFILAEVCKNLREVEGCELMLRGGSKLVLKSSPGPINRKYPWIDVIRAGQVIAEIFTDVEFLSMSHSLRGSQGKVTRGDYHEIDIALVAPGAKGRPSYNQIFVAVECKNATYIKSMLKEILGVRRELSVLQDPTPTRFKQWPAKEVPAYPSSCVLVYSSSPDVKDFAAPGETFGIQFFEKRII